jgi:WhiB family redox-sensing transcriptional regulator
MNAMTTRLDPVAAVTIAATDPRNANATQLSNPIQEYPMSTFELSALDLDVLATEPLAPDEPRPPGRDPDRACDFETTDDESLEARALVARCADGNGTMAGLFFSDHVVDIARAKAMCALCPLRLECLSGALEREEPWGVWGGELVSGGRIVANKRPCGRPPKHPRPEVTYDEMGPVAIPA